MQANKFYTEWFLNPHWWFDKDPKADEYIQSNYEGLLDVEWSKDHPLLMKVLIWDQLPRHVFRGQHASHIIDFFLQKAVAAVREYDECGGSWDADDGMTDEEFMFLWLPYRHTRDYRYILPVMEKAWARLRMNSQSEIMRKFLRATFSNVPTDNQEWNITLHQDVSTADVDAYTSILEYDGKMRYDGEVPKDMGDYDRLCDKKAVIVSLSGGVDSMVTLDIIKKRYPHVAVAAVHINYDNRDTSMLEEQFVRWWCEQNDIPLYVRVIHEIHRGPCMTHGFREVYETYTKNVRFGTYKTVWNKIMGDGSAPFVLLGHNEDDCFENVLTNATFRCKYDELRGMKVLSEQEGVQFFRPMLSLPKRKIIEYAKSMGIPYLYDSTPSWSQRGQIRDKVVPVLSTWNPACQSGLLQLANIMTELFTVMRSSVEEWLHDMRCVDDGVMEKHVSSLPTSEMFWKDLCVRGFRVCPSNRSLQNMMKRWESIGGIEVNAWHRVVIHKYLTISYTRKKDGSVCLRFHHVPKDQQ